MSTIFPPVKSVAPSQLAAGSIIKISRSSDIMLALVTSEKPSESAVSVVLLNARFTERPAVIFAQNWRQTEPCLCYTSGVEFEIDVDFVDICENKWWRTLGVIVSIDDQFYLRAGVFEYSSSRPPLINIQTGEHFSGQLQRDLWTFGAWTLWVRDETQRRAIKLCTFKAGS